MNQTVNKGIDLQVARKQLKTQTGSTANFLIRDDNSRDLLGKFHKDKGVCIRARRRILQCISYQFPCALQLKMWGILIEVKCRLCEKYYKENQIDPTNSVKSVRHIQCYCPALQRPRIAIHHRIWRELLFSILKSSTELKNKLEPRWHFPSAFSPEAHAQWGLYKILEDMGLHVILPPGEGQNITKLKRDIKEYHLANNIDFEEGDHETFISRRPDGPHLSRRETSGWKATQINFTTGVRGSLYTNQFLTRLETLGVKNKTRGKLSGTGQSKNSLHV